MASVRETQTITVNSVVREYITLNVYGGTHNSLPPPPQPPLFTYAPSTPIQFFPGQEPLFSNQGSNLRNMYKRAFNSTNTVDNTIRKQYIGRSTDSSGRMNRLKSINVGKYAYVRSGESVSTKSYDPTSVRSTIRMVRNN